MKVQILEATDGPLDTAPEPQRESYTNVVDYIKAGRPGMGTGVVGDSDSFGSFDYQERLESGS